MDVQHVNIKIFVEGELNVALERFIEIFHKWVPQNALGGLLIDIADYRHVPSGPGVMLIGFEADYSIDNQGSRWGLLYNRKAPQEGTNAGRLRDAFAAAANACRMLEAEFTDGSLKFSRREFEIIINDRLPAPNTAETFAAFKPELESFLKNFFGEGGFTIEHDPDPRRRFGVRVKLPKPFELAAP